MQGKCVLTQLSARLAARSLMEVGIIPTRDLHNNSAAVDWLKLHADKVIFPGQVIVE